MLQWLIRNVLGRLAAIPVRRRLRAFEAATHHADAVQQAVLTRIVTEQADTSFGKDHGFSSGMSLAEFRKNVPIAGYDYIEPYIRRVATGDVGALLSDPVIHMFAMTSGTTAKRKLIPVTNQYLADYKRGWNIWGLKVFRDHPNVRLKPIVQMSGDWQETTTESGVPCGAVTGLTAHMQLKIVKWIYCVPAAVGKLKDPAAKYYLALRLSLLRKPGMLIAANPSTLINLARAGDQEKESLLRDLYDGTLTTRFEIPADVRAAVASRLAKRNRERVRWLEEIVSKTGTLYPRDYWPQDLVIGNWMGGSVGAYLQQFPKYFGATPVRDVGLIASEGRMTIPLSDGTPSGVLDVTSHFFEFVPEGEIDRPNPTVLKASEISPGQNYYILLTTFYGLYRYNIFDVVRCTGYHNRTPLVEFLSKGAHIANLTGEKVSEYQVVAAVRQAIAELGGTIGTYSVAPVWDEATPYYCLYLEAGDIPTEERACQLARLTEKFLCEMNCEYQAKRESGRLVHLRVAKLPVGTWAVWDRDRLVRTGGTLEQFKHPCLISDLHFRKTVNVSGEFRVDG